MTAPTDAAEFLASARSMTRPQSVSNCRRILQTIGWHHAEPVVRSLCRVVIGHQGDSEADRLLWQGNRDLCAKMPAEWQEGKPSPEATTDLLAMMRQASPAETAQKVVELLKGGIAPQSIWDASFLGAAEALMRRPARPDNWSAGIIPLHADYKFTSAVFEDYEHVSPMWRDRFLASCMYIIRGDFNVHSPRSLQQAIQVRDRSEVKNVRLPGPLL